MSVRSFRSFFPVILLILAAAALEAQTASKKLTFEVATVKPAAPLDMAKVAADIQAGKMPNFGPHLDVSRATYNYVTLKELITLAYKVRTYQVDGPSWLATERFDVVGTYPEGATKADAPAMLRALLEERFKLSAHKQTQEHKVLALVVGKNGPKMKAVDSAPQPIDPDTPLQPGEQQYDSSEGPIRMKINPDHSITMNMGERGTIVQKIDVQNQAIRWESDSVSMSGFAETLSQTLSQIGGAGASQVVDMTGLKGHYHVGIEISLADILAMARSQGFAVPSPPPSGGANAGPASAASDPSGGTSIYQSVEQLGLKLEERKAPVEELVVDHVEKTATEN